MCNALAQYLFFSFSILFSDYHSGTSASWFYVFKHFISKLGDSVQMFCAKSALALVFLSIAGILHLVWMHT